MPSTTIEPFINSLLVALDFISCAQRPNGHDTQRHCMLSMHTAVAFDGLIAAGIRIVEELHCAPNTARLIAALENCSPGYSISHVAYDRLLVQSGDFQAYVPLCDPSTMQWAKPDVKQVVADDKIKAALKAVSAVVSDKAQLLQDGAILLQANTCVGTNGSVVLEAFHGWDLPPGILLPIGCVKALMKTQKPIVGIGYGNDTVTFWYEDESWIRTQRYIGEYPDAVSLLNASGDKIPFPIGLFTAVKQLAPFSEDGQVYCWNGKASSHPFTKQDSLNASLTLDVSGINDSRVYSISSIKLIEKFVQRYDDQTINKRTFFSGASLVKLGTRKSQTITVPMRGAMTHGTEVADAIDPHAPVALGHNYTHSTDDDDIPF